MKRVVFIVMFFVNGFVFANMPVIDISAIAAAIENGMTMYQQLQNAYNQYQTMVQQLEQTKKNLEGLDLTNLDLTIYNKMLESGDKYLSDLENVENLLKKKDLKIGNVSFSLEDLYKTDVYKYIDGAKDLLDSSNMSGEEITEFFMKYGMNVDTFNKVVAVTEQLGEKGKQAVGFCLAAKDAVEEGIEIASSVKKEATNIMGEVALEQRNLQTLGDVLQQTSITAKGVVNIAEMLSVQISKTITDEQKKEETESLYGTYGSSPDYVRNSVGDEKDYLQWK